MWVWKKDSAQYVQKGYEEKGCEKEESGPQEEEEGR